MRCNYWHNEPDEIFIFIVKLFEVEIYNIFKGDISFSEYTNNLKQEIDKIRLQQDELIKKRNDAILMEGCDQDED